MHSDDLAKFRLRMKLTLKKISFIMGECILLRM
jgi:hypothetical protein